MLSNSPRPIRQTVLVLAAAAACALPASAVHAAVNLLQPPRVIDASKPLTLTLVVSAQEHTRQYLVPDTLEVDASADPVNTARLSLKRITPGPAAIRLRRGEHRAIEYQGAIPETLRGQVRLDPVGIDAAPVLVTLNLAGDTATAAAPARASAAAAAPAPGAATPPATLADADSDADGTPAAVPAVQPAPGSETMARAPLVSEQSRLTFHEPVYFAAGAHGGGNAKFQFSLRYRLFEGRDPGSRALLDNLYLGYTQFSLWDLSEESKPFRDTNYRPSLFYYLSDTGVRGGPLRQLSLATGLEHESNGRSGPESRSINTVFIRPTFHFGKADDYHWTVSPKLYYYLNKADENGDIAHYRGYMDLRVAYGRPDSWELAATLRKGTRDWYGSVDAQLSYPLARLIPGTGGYLMAGYFAGYGESLLDYNRKVPWQFRIGYMLNR
ncbi:phospholipase A [Cupriavidus sp. AU9028]|nr:phospholipase A [Cupriavidus sp. AU9028]